MSWALTREGVNWVEDHCCPFFPISDMHHDAEIEGKEGCSSGQRGCSSSQGGEQSSTDYS